MYLARRNFGTLPHAFKQALNISKVNDPAKLSLSKIVATIGPASENVPMIHHVFGAGMGIMRINFSHATYDEADLRVKNMNSCRNILSSSGLDSLGQVKNMCGIMLDTQGPEIRTGSFADVKELELVTGTELILTTNDAVRNIQQADKLWVSYKLLPETVKPSSIILLDDGAIQLEVLEVLPNKDIRCKVLNTRTLGNKKGVNIPGLPVMLPALSTKDRADLKWGVENDIDYIAASFTRKPSDIVEIKDYYRQLLAEKAKETGDASWLSRPLPKIISKIESTEALENFEGILAETDAIMVARGDLAVEIPMETLAAVQREIVLQCNQAGKPVIVATQMLETMQKNPRPTRAELTDVANAILQGADCVMLSGESAKGKYPTESVSMMKSIVDQTELSTSTEAITAPSATVVPLNLSKEEGIAYSAVQLSRTVSSIAGIVIALPSESLHELSSTVPAFVAKYKPFVPIYVLVPSYKAGRLLQLHRGVHGIVYNNSKVVHDSQALHDKLVSSHVIAAGSEVVVVHQDNHNKKELAITLARL